MRVTGSSVFEKCTKLSEVTTSKYTNIGEHMFAGCTSLTSFTFKGSYLNVGTFNGCTGLTSFTFEPEEEFVGIGAYALAGTKIQNIKLPDGEYSISESAFDGSALRNVTLSRNTHIVGAKYSPFANCKYFGQFIVEEGNAYYSVGNDETKDKGVLYNADKTQLISVPTAKTVFELSDSVVSVAAGAFASCKALDKIDLSNVSEIGEYAFANSTVKMVVLPTGMTSLPDGMFANCANLTSVEALDGVTEVGDYAFKGTTALKSVSLPNATEIGNNAFQNSGVTSVDAPNVQVIGTSAFASSKLIKAEFTKTTQIGDKAFASCSALTEVSFGGVTEMGREVFNSTSSLAKAVFGEGTKVIGDYAFFASSNREKLTQVVLPDGVEKIGEFAFYKCSAITSINTTSVKEIGNYAFYGCSALSQATLTGAETIGKGAFSETALTSANLANAKYVDSYAFMSAPLETITLEKVEFIGDYAFANTKLVSVTLPASFNKATYKYSWSIYDEKGRVEKVKTRNISSFGAGAFSSIETLIEINASVDGEIKSIDGVLYAVTPDGLELLQYPAAKSGKSFVTPTGTIAIGDSAFEGVNGLESIEFVYTVERIGSYAFYTSSVTNYTFNSVEAPTLIAKYVDTTGMSSSDIVCVLFRDSRESTTNTTYLGSTIYYANFFDYVAKRVYADLFNPTYYTAPDFKLTMTIPQNGTGYDTNIWTNFFSTVNKTEDILPDATTHEAIDAIDGISSVMSLDEIAAADSIEALDKVVTVVREARLAYNAITDKAQLALVTKQEQTLLAAEKALRDAKARLGQPVALSEVTIASIPTKIRYKEGEAFDASGMVLKAIFADGSEVNVTDFTVDKSTFALGDDKVIISYVYEGTTYNVELRVNVEAKDAVVNPDKDKTNGKDDKDNLALIVSLSVVIPVVVIAVVAVATILVVKKKKLVAKKNEQAQEDDETQENQSKQSVADDVQVENEQAAENESDENSDEE